VAALGQEAVGVVHDPHGGDGQGAEGARGGELILQSVDDQSVAAVAGRQQALLEGIGG
jgi:hypothetical protein